MPLKIYQEAKKNKGIQDVRHVVGIAAGKGGVGKSTVTVNLARALKARGYKVGVLDTDLYGPSVRKMLPENRLPGKKDEKIVPATSEGIRVLSIAHFRREEEAAAVRAPIANNVIQQFLHGTEWGALDYLLIDFPPGTGDIQITLAQQARLAGALMVTTPQAVAVMDVRKAMSLFRQVKVPIIGIVENMSYYQHSNGEKTFPFGRGGGERLALESGLPFLGQIPLEPTVSDCGDSGKSLFQQEDNSAARAFDCVTDSFIAQLNLLQEKDGKGMQKFELVWKEMAE